MRFFIFFLLAIAAVSAVPVENLYGRLRSFMEGQNYEINKNTEHNCEPLKLFKRYCNTCVCTADGKNSTCTTYKCIEGVYSEDGYLLDYDPNVKHSCVPYKHFTVNCNHCWCDWNGITASCTDDKCASAGCEPDKVTRTGCTECTCSSDGEQLTCFSKYCRDPVYDIK